VSRPSSETLTNREAQLMDVLWNLGTATAEQVREALPDRPHDSTVRTLLRVLETKGYVTHDDRGRAYTYRPAVDRSKAQRTAVRGLVSRLFGNSAQALVLRLLEDEVLTPEQLEEIRQSVEPGSKSRAKPESGPKRRHPGGLS
jgi:BlaI family transcriptional regulator, penicillinase repressor